MTATQTRPGRVAGGFLLGLSGVLAVLALLTAPAWLLGQQPMAPPWVKACQTICSKQQPPYSGECMTKCLECAAGDCSCYTAGNGFDQACITKRKGDCKDTGRFYQNGAKLSFPYGSEVFIDAKTCKRDGGAQPTYVNCIGFVGTDPNKNICSNETYQAQCDTQGHTCINVQTGGGAASLSNTSCDCR